VNDETLARHLARAEQQYFGKYRGFVQDRNDPEKLGRLKVTVPSLLNEAVTGWAWPVLPYAGAGIGFFFLPQVGDLVWVEFLEGDLDHPLWSGGSWAKPKGQTEIPADAKANYPDTQVLRTKSGHVLILEDSAGKELITLRAKNGCELTIDPNGDAITLKASSTITLQAGDIELKSNGTTLPLATQDFVEKVFKSHFHPSGVGPTGPPTHMPPVPTALTSVVKAE